MRSVVEPAQSMRINIFKTADRPRAGSKPDHLLRRGTPLLSAKSRLMHCNKRRRGVAMIYSITSSARASSVGGTGRPSALAVVRFMTRSNRVGCSTGMSTGLAPRRILSAISSPPEQAREVCSIRHQPTCFDIFPIAVYCWQSRSER
jgi:hypothetical protein